MAVTRKTANSNGNNTTTAASKPATGADAFAQKFNAACQDAKNGNSFEPLPFGTWEVLTKGAGTYDKDGKTSAFIDFVVVEDGAKCHGKSGRKFFALLDEEGELSKGAEILSRDLATLGRLDLDEGIKSLSHLKEILEDLGKNPVWLTVTVTANKGFTNMRIASVFEDQDDQPEMPE